VELIAFTLASLFLAPEQRRSDPAVSRSILFLAVLSWVTLPLWASAALDVARGPSWAHWVIPPVWYAATLMINVIVVTREEPK
jgi:hypothetical protein